MKVIILILCLMLAISLVELPVAHTLKLKEFMKKLAKPGRKSHKDSSPVVGDSGSSDKIDINEPSKDLSHLDDIESATTEQESVTDSPAIDNDDSIDDSIDEGIMDSTKEVDKPKDLPVDVSDKEKRDEEEEYQILPNYISDFHVKKPKRRVVNPYPDSDDEDEDVPRPRGKTPLIAYIASMNGW